MFNTKKKSGSKIRFQHQAFKQQLRDARGYKRDPLKNSRTSSANISGILKLGSTLTRLTVAAMLALLIYFIYVPNFLYVKKIEITGISPENSGEMRELLAQYFAAAKILPQNNILILSKKSLSSFLLAEDKNLQKITAITKRLPGTLLISAEPRSSEYLLESPDGSFIVSNDYKIAPTGPLSASSSLIRVKIALADNLEKNSVYPNPGQLAGISQLANRLPLLLNDSVEYFAIASPQDSEITVYGKSKARYIFDYKNDLPATMEKFHLLLTSIAPKDLNQLFYVDMTIKNRGYVCLKNSACAKPPESLPNTASSTSPASSALELSP